MDEKYESADVIITQKNYEQILSTPVPKSNFDYKLNRFANAFKRNIVHAMTLATSSKKKTKVLITLPERMYFTDSFLLNSFSNLRYKFSIHDLHKYLKFSVESRLNKKIDYIMKGKFEKFKDEK